MRIALDINGIEETSGLGSYLRQLVSNLAALDTGHEFLLYRHHRYPLPPDFENRYVPKSPGVRLVFHRMPSLVSLFSEYRLGLRLTESFLKKHGVDLYHGPSNVVPKLRDIPSVLTLHHYTSIDDPLFADDPRGFKDALYFDFAARAVRAATHVITVSEHTREVLVESLGLPDEKCTAVHNGGPIKEYRPLTDSDPVPPVATRLKEPFFVFPGPVTARKNLPGLMKAFADVRNEIPRHRLAITFIPSSEYAGQMLQRAKNLGIADRVDFLGAISLEDLVYLYNKAEALLYPSLSEGFGAPPLEAMACGCPVLASKIASIPEVLQDSALLVDPSDEKEIGEGLVRIADEKDFRDDLIRRGFERATAFSWKKTARETLEVYEKTATKKA